MGASNRCNSYRIRKSLLTWFFFTLFSFCSFPVGAESVKVGYIEFPPYTYTANDGKPAGIFIELARTVFNRLGIDIESEISYPTARLVRNMGNGDIDVWYGAMVPELEETAIYGKEPIGRIEMNIYAVENLPVVNRVEDLKGKRVITILGYGYGGWGRYLRDVKNGVECYQTKSHEIALDFLKTGRVDYLLDYTCPVNNALKTITVPGLVKKRLKILSCYFSVSRKRPECVKLIQRIDSELKKMK